jgi:hypothetical protein
MALYEIVLQEQVNASVVINRWNYLSSGTPTGVTGSFALLVAFGAVPEGDPLDFPSGTVMAAIKAVQAADTIFVGLNSINVYEDDDFITTAFPTGIFGGVAGASSAQFVAGGLRTNRITRAVRRGFKRIAGVPAAAVGEIGGISGTYLTNLNALASVMSETLEYTEGGNALSFVPCVVSKQPYETPAGNTAYRYYASLETQLDHVASGVTWETYSNVRSQGSRQLGRGA